MFGREKNKIISGQKFTINEQRLEIARLERKIEECELYKQECKNKLEQLVQEMQEKEKLDFYIKNKYKEYAALTAFAYRVGRPPTEEELIQEMEYQSRPYSDDSWSKFIVDNTCVSGLM